jgi:hypothetical protein
VAGNLDFLRATLLDRTEQSVASIVYQYIDAAELCQSSINCFFRLQFVGYINWGK